jgi:hypothetical protein
MSYRLTDHRRLLEAMEYKGPLLSFDQLTLEEKQIIHADFMSLVRQLGAEGVMEMWILYAQTLHIWGIMCPHPQGLRLYDGFQQADMPLSFEDSHWYSCRLCSAIVINRQEI